MKIHEIAKHFGLASTAKLAEMFDLDAKVLRDYVSGRRGTHSRFITDLVRDAGLLYEAVIFPDSFDDVHTGENPDHQNYWLNLAIESLREAEKRGLDKAVANEIVQKIYEVGNDLAT
jgi:hypothetical protein